MAMVRRIMALTLVGMVAVSTTGCTFFACSGGGPLRYEELGDWAGIEAEAALAPEELSRIAEELQQCEFSFTGTETAVSIGGVNVRGRYNSWLHYLPGKRHSDFLIQKTGGSDSRRIYSSWNDWGCGFLIGELLLSGEQRDEYDVATGRRIGAFKANVVLTPLVWMRQRQIMPADERGKSGLGGRRYVLDPANSLTDVSYNLKDGTIALFGMIGWGRVNRKRCIQILWIPIPVGDAKL